MVGGMKKKPKSRRLLNLSLRVRPPARRELKIPFFCFAPRYSEKHDYGFLDLKDSKSLIDIHVEHAIVFRLLHLLFRNVLKFHSPKVKQSVIRNYRTNTITLNCR